MRGLEAISIRNPTQRLTVPLKGSGLLSRLVLCTAYSLTYIPRTSPGSAIALWRTKTRWPGSVQHPRDDDNFVLISNTDTYLAPTIPRKTLLLLLRSVM